MGKLFFTGDMGSLCSVMEVSLCSLVASWWKAMAAVRERWAFSGSRWSGSGTGLLGELGSGLAIFH